MHCETLLRLSRPIEEVNFTSVRKTNIALSVLEAKQLHWTPISYGEKKLEGLRLTPQQNGKNISGGWHSELGAEPPNPR